MSEDSYDYDIEDIRHQLRDRVESLAERLKGKPDKAGRRDHRWGSNGKFSLRISGSKRGRWYIHDGSRQGGAELEFIRHELRMDFEGAVRWAADWLGIKPLSPDDRLKFAATTERDRRARLAQRERDQAKEAAEEAARVRKATVAAGRKAPLESTPAELYLKSRGIPVPPSGWPSCIGYDRRNVALIGEATAADGTVTGLQRVLLTNSGKKRPESELGQWPAVKTSSGVLSGSAMRMPGPSNLPLLVDEGFEDAVTIHAALGWETLCAFGVGNIAALEPPRGRVVIICANDDARGSQADMAVRRVVSSWRERGVDVRVIRPWTKRHYDGSDFNDLARKEGIDAVRQRLKWASDPLLIPPRETPAPIARVQIRQLVRDWGDKILAETPEYLAINSTTGSGKTTIAIEEIIDLIKRMEEKGDERSIVLSVPTVELAQDKADLANRIQPGIAAVFRGRDADDPNRPGHKMCERPEPVTLAHSLGLPVVLAACRRKMPDGKVSKCPLYDECAHVAQSRQKAKLWVVAHAFLYVYRPAVIGEIAGLVCDESPWREGTKTRDQKFNTHLLDTPFTVPGDPDGTEWLRAFLSKISTLLWNVDLGPLAKRPFWVQDIVAADANRARRLLFECKVDPKMYPTMTKEQRAAAEALAAINRIIFRVARLLSVIEGLLEESLDSTTTWCVIEEKIDADEGVRRVAVLSRRVPISATWVAPTIFLDATARCELLQFHWPSLWTSHKDEIHKLTVKRTADNASLDEAETQHIVETALLSRAVAADTVRMHQDRIRQLLSAIGRLKTAIAATTDRVQFLERTQQPKLRVIQIAAPHQRIVQVCDYAYSFAQLDASDTNASEKERHLRARRLRQVRASIVRWLAQFDGEKLIIAPLRLELLLTAMGPIPHTHFAHHNNIAGLDRFKHVRALVQLGRITQNPKECEATAEALTGKPVHHVDGWYDRVDAVRLIKDGTAVPAETDCHPDPIAEAIRWRTCEGETLQVIGRPRGINREADNPVDVLLLTDTVLPIAIDKAISHKEIEPTAADMMLAEWGVMFTNPAHAVLAGERSERPLWKTREAAAKAGVTKHQNAPEGTQRVTYQLAGPGHRPESAWFDLDAIEDVEPVLAELLGELSGPIGWEEIVYFHHSKILFSETTQARSEPTPPADPPPSPDPDPTSPPIHVPRVFGVTCQAAASAEADIAVGWIFSGPDGPRPPPVRPDSPAFYPRAP